MFTGRSYYTNVLWALEKLVWFDDYVIRAIELLAKINEKQFQYKLANTPINSLYSIFCVWYPQSCLSCDQRIKLIHRLQRRLLMMLSLEISVEQQPYPVLFTVTEEGCKAFAPDFPKIQIQAGTMETALMEAKKQIQKALSQFKYPPIPTRQEDIVVQENSVLILLKTA